MSPEPALRIVRALILLISFTGLCAGLRVGLRLHRMIAPFVAVSSIIVLLMLGGMLGALKLTFYLIYFAGFGGLIYAYWLRRARPEWGLIAAMLVFVACLVWRFYPCPLYLNDDISHWGLVARHLLRYDCFPDAGAAYVRFQSYPLGAACFIYYISRTIADTEGMYLVAMYFLLGPLFLPLLAHVRENRRISYPFAAALFLVLMHFHRPTTVQVDTTQAFFGIGLAASIAFERGNWKRALGVALPGMIAVTYIKSSGAFFALTSLCMLLRCARPGEAPRGARAALIAVSTVAAAYLLWNLHIRLRFPAALTTKHAVSLSAYAARASAKDMGVVLATTKAMLRKMLKFTPMQLCAGAFMIAGAALILLICRNVPEQRNRRRALLRAWFSSIAVYLLWVLMIWIMYIVSMPNREAMEAASFTRYNSTGLAYMVGLTSIALLDLLSGEGVGAYRLLRALPALSAVLMAAVAVLYALPAELQPWDKGMRNTHYIPLRASLRQAQAEYGLPDGGRYLLYATDSAPYREYYYTKYEYFTADIHAIGGTGPFRVGTRDGNEEVADVRAFIRENIDDCDAFLITGSSENFDRQLASFRSGYTGDTPIIYIQE